MSDNQSPASPLSPVVSPLLEADPNSLNELIQERIDEIMNIRPLMKDQNGNYILTDAKLTEMVNYYRKKRVIFLKESQQKELKPREKRQKKPPASVAEALASSEDLL
jgi:predicted ATP-binding protein involved in virulence